MAMFNPISDAMLSKVGLRDNRLDPLLEVNVDTIMELVLMPRQIGHHIYSEEALEMMKADAVGNTFKFKNLANYNGLHMLTYEHCVVISAWIDDKGLCGRIRLVK